MSGLELTGRLPCPGSGRPPCLLYPALLFPPCRERWEKGEVRPEEHPSRGSGGGVARGGLWGGRSSCCRCHCYRRCHIGSLLYRQRLRSCDRSRAADTTVRSRPRERARGRVVTGIASQGPRHLATPPPFRSQPILGSMRFESGSTLTPTPKICLRKRNLIHPGRLIERILTACEAPQWL